MPPIAQPAAPPSENRILYEIISTVGSSLELEQVLAAVVGLLSDASAVHACFVYLVEDGGERLVLHAASDPYAHLVGEIALERGEGLAWWAAEHKEPAFTQELTSDPRTKFVPELEEEKFQSLLSVPIIARDSTVIGVISLHTEAPREFTDPEVEVLASSASLVAGAIENARLYEETRQRVGELEQLTEKNLIKDFFEQLAGGSVPGDLEGRAARLGCDLDQRYIVLAAAPVDDALEKAVAAAAPRGSLFDRRDDSIRGLLRIPMSGEEPLVEKLREVHAALDTPVSVGISHVCQGAASFRAGFEEAQHALLGASVIRGKPAVMTYEELGPYKYLLRMPIDSAMRDQHRDAVTRIAEYDRQRQTALLRTLEEFLRRRGNISATAEALYVHPNTLRQRLRRIQELSGIDLRKDDWLLVEIAVKMVKLQEALGR